jgi:hypothetical protein
MLDLVPLEEVGFDRGGTDQVSKNAVFCGKEMKVMK